MEQQLDYYQVHTIKELVATYYVKATSKEEATDLAWNRFDEERERLQLENCWSYETQIDYAGKQDSDEWLVEDDEGYAVYVAEEEDFLAAVNNGGEV
jgi:hypothetical protein